MSMLETAEVVAERAKLSTPFVNLALVPEAASSLLLPARIGHVRAFAMFALGEVVSAADASSLGLANKVLPKDQVLLTAREAARTLATRPVGAIVATKRLMRDKQRIPSRMAEEGAVFAERLQTNEAREAFMLLLSGGNRTSRKLHRKMAAR
jgi:enoyl-CoA hydratase/carnithine racemase